MALQLDFSWSPSVFQVAENPLTPPTPSLTHFNLEFEDRVKKSQLLLGWRGGMGECGKKKERERDAPGAHPEGIQELGPLLPPCQLSVWAKGV